VSELAVMSRKPYRWCVDGVRVNRAHAFVEGKLDGLCRRVLREAPQSLWWVPDRTKLRCGQCVRVLRAARAEFVEVRA